MTAAVSAWTPVSNPKAGAEARWPGCLSDEAEHLAASIPSLLIGLGEEDRVLAWNATTERLLGLNRDEVQGRQLADCPVAWDWHRVAGAIEACKSQRRPVRLDNVICQQNGGPPLILGLTLTPMAGGGASPLRMMLIGADVTERKQLEEQLAQAQKMEAIGHLAAGIAHEISTPAQFVGDNTQFLREAFADLHKVLAVYRRLAAEIRRQTHLASHLEAVDQTVATADLAYLEAEIPQALAHIRNGVERISKIVHSMKLFAHPGGDDKVPVDLNEAIEGTIVITRNEWKYVADLTTDLDPELPPVPCRRGEFNQVILNLITNAAHAIADARKGSEQGRGRIQVITRRRDGWAEIRIADTGTGIPEAIRHKVFDLFFTTKEEGRGSGQGLALAHAVVVDQHGGQLTFETQEGQGTTFILRLPLAELAAHG